MISSSSLAIASHHAVVADFISDPKLALTEVSYGQFSISLGVEDAKSLLHLYDRLKRPGRRPKVSVVENTEHWGRFGPYTFIMLKEFYSKPEHSDVEIVASLLLTNSLDVHAVRTIKPGLALIESLAASQVGRKDESNG